MLFNKFSHFFTLFLPILLSFVSNSNAITPAPFWCRNAVVIPKDNDKLPPAKRKKRFPGDAFKVTLEQATAAMNAAKDTSPGRSGYPHVFKNVAPKDNSPIRWQNARCNGERAGSTEVQVYEYPVLLNGKTWIKDNSKLANAAEDPGPARVIFMQGRNEGTRWPKLELCGVIAHINGNAGELKSCTPMKPTVRRRDTDFIDHWLFERDLEDLEDLLSVRSLFEELSEGHY